MEKLKIAYFQSRYGNKFDKFIDNYSGRYGYSHSELVIDSQTTIGASFINKGVGKFKYSNIFNSKKWTIVEYDLPAQPAIDFAETLIGKDYDAIGVMLHYINIDIYDSKDKWWCSELTTHALYKSLYESLGIKTEITEDTLLMPNEAFINLSKYKTAILENTLVGANTDLAKIDHYDRIGIYK